MGRMKLWRDNKTNDYKFQDKIIGEFFDISGTQVFVHRYVGVIDEDGNVNEDIKIQDLLFMESRDRKYDKDVVEMWGVYQVSDNDFELSQFGFFMSDTLYLDFHINSMAAKLGRKLSTGDVIELTHLRDDLLEGEEGAVNAFYVIEEGRRSAEGYGPTWLPHIWRVRIKKIFDSREYNDVLGNIDEESDDDLLDIISNHNQATKANEASVAEAEEEVPYNDYVDDYIYRPELDGAEEMDNGIDLEDIPKRTSFPVDAEEGDYVIRIDYKPSQIFIFKDEKWELVDQKYYREWAPGHEHHESFIENDKTFEDGDRGVRQEETYISNPINPIVDNDDEDDDEQP